MKILLPKLEDWVSGWNRPSNLGVCELTIVSLVRIQRPPLFFVNVIIINLLVKQLNWLSRCDVVCENHIAQKRINGWVGQSIGLKIRLSWFDSTFVHKGLRKSASPSSWDENHLFYKLIHFFSRYQISRGIWESSLIG